jgi:hypothetical protein
MFYHLHRRTLRQRASGGEWHLRPDERVDIDWSTIETCLRTVGNRKRFDLPLFRDIQRECDFVISTFRQVTSSKAPLAQVADLFAGIAPYTREKASTVVENCWRSETDFPLQAALLNTAPLFRSGPDFAAYSGAATSAVAVSKIAYFSLSVIWRAGVHQWKQYGHEPEKLMLGPYQEQLRGYLIDKGEFPPHVVLIVTVSTTSEAKKNSMMLFPWLSEQKTCHQYVFVIPGVTFQVFVGKGISSRARDCCMVSSPRQYLVSD